MGGASIMQVAAKRPDLVSGIVLLEPVLISNLNLSVLRLAKAFPFTKIISCFQRNDFESREYIKKKKKISQQGDDF